MSVKRLDHINVTTTKLAETRQFFLDVLGLEEGDRPDFPFPGHWLYADGHALVHLVGTEGSRSHTPEAALDHFALEATGYEDMLARLTDMSIEYFANDIEGLGLRQLFFSDPNGVTIELDFRAG
jgi:catechol 2,3-dioxygenase-like lactoylglutathione lyase family enzyme